jgi:hypothetical protein
MLVANSIFEQALAQLAVLHRRQVSTATAHGRSIVLAEWGGADVAPPLFE